MRSSFHATCLRADASPSAWRTLLGDYGAIVRNSLDAIITRSERLTGGTLLETKLDLISGGEPDPDDPIRGRSTVYGWTQARGLESLGRHCQWLASSPDPGDADLARRTRRLLCGVLHRLTSIRQRQGRLAFMMDLGGFPLRVTDRGAERDDDDTVGGSTLTDLFFAKGLAEAAAALGDDGRLREADMLFRQVVSDTESGYFTIDQQALDPKNLVHPIPGRHTHAPWMLSIGGATRLYHFTGDPWYADVGRRFSKYLLEHHVAAEAEGTLTRGDFWEFLDDGGGAYVAGNVLWSDPGHAIEAAGLALRHLRAAGGGGPGEQQRWVEVIIRNFQNGFTGTGICKAVDLNTRQPINCETPWWSLPETMRAAAEAMVITADAEQAYRVIREVFVTASNTFIRHYLRPEHRLLSIQCLDGAGQPVHTIPAVPDIDPGYHTNLCLIEVIDLFRSHNYGFGCL